MAPHPTLPFLTGVKAPGGDDAHLEDEGAPGAFFKEGEHIVMDIWPRQLRGQGSRESLARLFGDLSHPLRLAVVTRLLSVEKECVCGLARSCRADQPTLSRHLRILKDHGVVADRREGVKVFYQVVDPRAAAILSCIKIVGPDQGGEHLKQEGP